VAREGLSARVHWCDGELYNMRTLVLEKLLEQAVRGLQSIGIQTPQPWLDIIRQRVQTGRTGAQWITDFWQKYHDERALVRAYLNNAQQNVPVHLWPEP